MTTTQTTTIEARTCRCGCDQTVGRKATYRPGHDARHAAQVAGELAGLSPKATAKRRTLLDTLPTDALRAKAERIAEKVKIDAAKKAAKAGDLTGAVKQVRDAKAAKAPATEAVAGE